MIPKLCVAIHYCFTSKTTHVSTVRIFNLTCPKSNLMTFCRRIRIVLTELYSGQNGSESRKFTMSWKRSKFSFFKLSKISFFKLSKFPFSNCQKCPLQTVNNFLFKLSKIYFSNWLVCREISDFGLVYRGSKSLGITNLTKFIS